MIFVDLIFALLIALLLASLLVGAIGWRHPRHGGAGVGLLFLFILFFVVVWGAGVWAPAWGPAMWGGYWMPFLVVGAMVALIVLAIGSAAAPPRPPIEDRAVDERPEEREGDVVATGLAAVFGVFFWILIIAAVVIIIVRYAT